jgi:hypothetical protein
MQLFPCEISLGRNASRTPKKHFRKVFDIAVHQRFHVVPLLQLFPLGFRDPRFGTMDGYGEQANNASGFGIFPLDLKPGIDTDTLKDLDRTENRSFVPVRSGPLQVRERFLDRNRRGH